MIPKYKYKYQNQRRAGTTVAYCKFEVQARGRFLTTFGWATRTLVMQKFETFTPALRHVNYKKPVMTEPTWGETSDDPSEINMPVEHVDKLVVYDTSEIWSDIESFFDVKNETQPDDPFYTMITKESHICK